MYLTLTFPLATLLLMLAWHGPRGAVLGLSALTFAVAVAVYLHHATDKLPLSF
ncbi:hypothetical protein SAMN05519104_4655 [Rhizobiales bacterium GAS188]|nr:hypothetical protein SAMN05519104_4655 [Rhizobiales bacterium GAS188]